MRELTFELITDDRFTHYIRRDIQEKIEQLQKKFTNMNDTYIKISKPIELTFQDEGNKQYRAFCSVVKDKGSKYTWNDIMKAINEVKAPVYRFRQYHGDMKEYKEIKQQRKNAEVISSHLVGVYNNIYDYSTAIVVNGEKYIVDVVKKINEKNEEEWSVGDGYKKQPLTESQKEHIIETLKSNPPINFKTKVYVDGNIEVIDDLSKINFEEEIEINDGKIDLYFGNAYGLFLTPFEDYEFNYYDGYLSIDYDNNESNIDIVVISDNDDRIYYNYKPTEKETEILINAAEEYCQQYNGQTLKELLDEVNKEESQI